MCCVTDQQLQSDAGWAAGVLLILGDFLNGGRGHGQKWSHGPQLPTGCVDQLQDCSVSEDGQKKGREKTVERRRGGV